MNRILRAKIRINSVAEGKDNYEKSETFGQKTSESINAGAVYSEDKSSENYAFSVATPSLSLSMHINNPGAFDKLIQGKEYYLDFVPVESETNEEEHPTNTESEGLGADYGSRL